jgi:inhibitor of KinA
VEIPVCYGGDLGPDLGGIAEWAGLTVEDVIRAHAAVPYRVYMLGFLPGFAYLGAVDPRIAMPRRTTPRLRVPAGSVAIAGPQTGVYPADAPGGWHLIGRTPLTMFDVARTHPSLLAPGDRVEFRAVDRDAYEHARSRSGESGS